MLLLREIEKAEEGLLLATGWIPANCPAATEGRASTMMAVELAAQAAAVHEALLHRGLLTAIAPPPEGAAPQEPIQGYLVGLRRLQLRRPTVTVDDPLGVRIQRHGGAGALVMYDIEVWRQEDEAPVLGGRLSNWALPS